jgi:hypothetical protein
VDNFLKKSQAEKKLKHDADNQSNDDEEDQSDQSNDEENME